MGYTTEHRCRRPSLFVPGTGQFLNSACIRTNSRVAQGAYLEVEYIRNVLSVSGTLKYADSGTA